MKLTLLALIFSAGLFAADATGKWAGTFTKADAGGEAKTMPAFLILKQEGKVVSGSGGPNETEQHAISNGKVEGDHLTFEVSTEGGPLSFSLVLKGDQIKGDMKRETEDGKTETATLDVKRVSN